jgi:hypothetical protein
MFQKRAESTDEVYRDGVKLVINGVYGKTLEDRSKRTSSTFFTDKEKWLQAASHPVSDYMLIRQEPFLGLASKPQRKAVVLDTPRYIGWCFLQRSKAHMYKFWYETIRPVFGPRATLLYMHTDSFLIKFVSENLSEDLQKCNQAKINLQGKLLGMFKDEAESYRKNYGPGDFKAYIGLAAKLYAMLFGREPTFKEDGSVPFSQRISVMKARGAPKHALENFDEYLAFSQGQ